MKPLIATVFCLLVFCSFQLTGQQTINFVDDITERACPYDTSVTGFFPNQYAVYLTLDDTYEGTVDSSWCPVFTYNSAQNWYELELENFDFERPIFVKLSFPIGGAPALQPYRDYQVQANHPTRNVTYREASDCPGDCNQIYLAYTMADPVLGDTLQRRFELDGDYAEISGPGCFFSERYPQQRLDEIGQTIWLNRNGGNPRLIFSSGYSLFDTWWLDVRAEVNFIIFRERNTGRSPSRLLFPLK